MNQMNYHTNNNKINEIINKSIDYGNTDHGLYDEYSSNYLLKEIYENIDTLNDIYEIIEKSREVALEQMNLSKN